VAQLAALAVHGADGSNLGAVSGFRLLLRGRTNFMAAMERAGKGDEYRGVGNPNRVVKNEIGNERCNNPILRHSVIFQIKRS